MNVKNKKQQKKERKEESLRKKSQKKILVAAICTVIVTAMTVFFLINAQKQSESKAHRTGNQQTKIRVYFNGNQMITLNPNGTFAARLAHNNNIDGTYTETSEGNTVHVSFTYRDITANGIVLNNVLEIPREWDDGHGHGNRFRLR